MSEWTIAKVLSWAAQDFKTKDFDSPRLDAELLLTAVLGCDRVRLILDSPRPLTTDELERYRSLIQRRRKGEPIAYILGEREFFGLSFKVDSRVLVPRPDTEVLVETALRRTQHISRFGRALDLCTGSGCVAVTLASQRSTWHVWASDVSDDALEVARGNALRLGTPQVSFRRGDLFEAAPVGERFDLITANPPYIAHEELQTLQRDVRDFEPHLALDGGTDGLRLLRRIAHGATERLQSGGVLALEIGPEQGNSVSQMLTNASLVDVEVSQDYAGRDRVVSGKRR